MEDAILTGVAHDRSEVKVTVTGVPDVPGYAAKVFRAVADADVNIDMVLQNISKVEDGKTDITFTCSRESGPAAVDKLTAEQGEIGFTRVLYDDRSGWRRSCPGPPTAARPTCSGPVPPTASAPT